MTLFEVCNGYIGESYVRCYVWAETPERALELAQERHWKKYKRRLPDNVVPRLLVSEGDTEFATEFNDSGWPDDE